MLWLAWLGVLLALFVRGTRRRLATLGLHAAAEFGFYTLLFTAVGAESFRTGMYSLYPALLLCAAFALVRGPELLLRLLRVAPEPALRAAGLVALLLTAALMWGHFAWARDSMVRKGASIDTLNKVYDLVRDKVLPQLGPEPVLMARDVHELHALTDARCVMIPFEDADTIRATAQRYGVTHILLFGDPAHPERPSLKDIDNLRWCEKVLQTHTLGGNKSADLLRVYRIKA